MMCCVECGEMAVVEVEDRAVCLAHYEDALEFARLMLEAAAVTLRSVRYMPIITIDTEGRL
jgi:hypothetical protein